MLGMELSWRHAYLLTAALAAGFVGGSMMRSASVPQDVADPLSKHGLMATDGSDPTSSIGNPHDLEPHPDLRSTDSLDDLLALSKDEFYERLALWLVDASSEDTVSLPAGEVRQWTLRNLAATWLPLDAPNAEAWLRELSEAEQADVRDFLKLLHQ